MFQERIGYITEYFLSFFAKAHELLFCVVQGLLAISNPPSYKVRTIDKHIKIITTFNKK